MAFTGISTLSDLNIQTLNNSAASYGLEKISMEFAKSLTNYNQQVTEILADLAEKTTVQKKVFDLASDMEMSRIDEFGKSRSKANTGRWEVAFPCDKFATTIGFSNEFLQRATVQELNNRFIGGQVAHQKNIVKQIKSALFTSASVSYLDDNLNREELIIRPFWNNDGTVIPTNNNGESFTSHTHFIGSTSGSVANDDVDSLIQKVTEHDLTDDVVVYINSKDLAKISVLTKFTKLSSALIVHNATDATVDLLDNSDLSNRLVGYWDNTIKVFVKRFVPQNYAICLALGAPVKVLAYRQLPYEGMQGLKINSHYAGEPLVSQEMICYEGFGVQNRSAGAVLQLNNSTFTSPTL